MTKERLAEIAKLLPMAHSGFFQFSVELDGTGFRIRKYPGDYFHFGESEATAELFQNAHPAITELLAEVRRLRGPTDIPPCPACGGAVLYVPNFGGYVTCTNDGCHISGPDNDPDGGKWQGMCAALGTARL